MNNFDKETETRWLSPEETTLFLLDIGIASEISNYETELVEYGDGHDDIGYLATLHLNVGGSAPAELEIDGSNLEIIIEGANLSDDMKENLMYIALEGSRLVAKSQGIKLKKHKTPKQLRLKQKSHARKLEDKLSEALFMFAPENEPLIENFQPIIYQDEEGELNYSAKLSYRLNALDDGKRIYNITLNSQDLTTLVDNDKMLDDLTLETLLQIRKECIDDYRTEISKIKYGDMYTKTRMMNEFEEACMMFDKNLVPEITDAYSSVVDDGEGYVTYKTTIEYTTINDRHKKLKIDLYEENVAWFIENLYFEPVIHDALVDIDDFAQRKIVDYQAADIYDVKHKSKISSELEFEDDTYYGVKK